MNEFSLIEKYFNWSDLNSAHLGVGDDCAVIDIESRYQLVTSVDTLIAGVHFPLNTSAADIAYKALAVNLSDLAAMGAKPKYFTLALTLPSVEEDWLSEFSAELKKLSTKFNISLIGGDTTKGSLSITINVIGEVDKGRALLRSTAKVGDSIFVSNTIGDAAYAWRQIESGKNPSKDTLRQLNRPNPQIFLGQKLVNIANACIDISDGLEQDLSHILTKSKVGASIDLASIPLSNEVEAYIESSSDWCLVIAGGDDYELCFTVPDENIELLNALQDESGFKITRIGVIDNSCELTRAGDFDKKCSSYQHF